MFLVYSVWRAWFDSFGVCVGHWVKEMHNICGHIVAHNCEIVNVLVRVDNLEVARFVRGRHKQSLPFRLQTPELGCVVHEHHSVIAELTILRHWTPCLLCVTSASGTTLVNWQTR